MASFKKRSEGHKLVSYRCLFLWLNDNFSSIIWGEPRMQDVNAIVIMLLYFLLGEE